MAKRTYTRSCKKCGARFESTGSTVNCQACRPSANRSVASKAPAETTCFCGKTVLPAKCPRNCEANRPSGPRPTRPMATFNGLMNNVFGT